MDKQEVIKVLREKLALWDKIIPLMTKATTVAMEKAQAMDQREKESKKSCHYDPNIKIKETLPIYNETAVHSRIKARHSAQCLAAAKKKFASLRVLLWVATIIGLVITAAPHIINFSAQDMSSYLNFANTIDFTFRSDSFQDLGFSIEEITAIFLAVFAFGAQACTIFFAGVTAVSSFKSKIRKRVPEFGANVKGMWMALTVILGIFALVTWITTTPVGLVSLVPVILAALIANAAAAKLPDATLPQATSAELAQLQEAKKLDEKNRAINEAEIKSENEKAQKSFIDAQKKLLKSYDATVTKCEQEIDRLTDEIAALKKQVQTDLLSEKDNNYNTIEQLLNYLENGRADTLKEALYMVDMAKERERDRETQRQIAHMQMENDRFMAQMKRDEERRYNDQLLAQQRDHNERIQREQSRHNAEVEAHNREMERELEKIKRDHNL